MEFIELIVAWRWNNSPRIAKLCPKGKGDGISHLRGNSGPEFVLNDEAEKSARSWKFFQNEVIYRILPLRLRVVFRGVSGIWIYAG